MQFSLPNDMLEYFKKNKFVTLAVVAVSVLVGGGYAIARVGSGEQQFGAGWVVPNTSGSAMGTVSSTVRLSDGSGSLSSLEPTNTLSEDPKATNWALPTEAYNRVYNPATSKFNYQAGGVGGFYVGPTSTILGYANVIPQNVYTSGTLALTEGQFMSPIADSLGNGRSTLGTKLAGEDLTNDVMKVEEQMLGYTTTTRGTANAVKTGAGFIHSVTFDRVTNGTTLTLYDALTVTGSPIDTITLDTTSTPFTLVYDQLLTTGLTVVTGGVGALPSIKINYR